MYLARIVRAEFLSLTERDFVLAARATGPAQLEAVRALHATLVEVDRGGQLRPGLLATLPEAGHMMHHEEPEAVAALIESFLAAAG